MAVLTEQRALLELIDQSLSASKVTSSEAEALGLLIAVMKAKRFQTPRIPTS
jgi:hypothetical protein